MSLIESNSTKLILPTNGVYQGRAVRPDVKYITIQITATFEGGNSGLLEIYYSIDGVFYDNFGDSWNFTTETNEAHVFKETQMKGSFFYVKWTNNGISAYTSFNLNTKLAETTSTVSVNGVIDIPEVDVNIEGQTVFSKIRDTAGNALNSTDNALNVYNVNSILGYALEETLQDIKAKTDTLTFFLNAGNDNLLVYDPQVSGKLDFIKTYTSRLNNDSTYTDAIQVAVKNTVGVSGNVNITNSSLPVTGTFYPSIQDVSGSISVSNFPATQNVSGNVNITNSSLAVTGTFYPSIQDVSGSVSVSNFPSTQDISGNVNITNSSLPVTGTFYPSIQDVSGSVSVSNFPSTQNVSGNVNITNSSLAVTGTFYPAIQDVSGSVNVGNFPATQNVSGNVNITNSSLAVTGTFYPAIQDVSGSISVSNFPATQNVSGNVNITNSSLAVTGSFYPAIQDVSGSVNVNTISGFALETGGVLDDIKTQLELNNYDTNGNLNVNVASGSISVSSVNIKDSSGNNLNSTSNALNNYITNSSLNTHCYGSSDGTTWHHLLTNPNGKLQTNAGVQDGSGNDITSTLNGAKRSLDVNVANTGALKVDISGVNTDTNRLTTYDASANTLLSRISIGAGADIISTFVFGNFVNNATIATGSFSTTLTFTAGSYGRRVILMYRDNAITSTDSISYYTDSYTGIITSMLLQTVYPIVNNSYRWNNVIINILPFTSLKIRNDSSTINNTGVYLTVLPV